MILIKPQVIKMEYKEYDFDEAMDLLIRIASKSIANTELSWQMFKYKCISLVGDDRVAFNTIDRNNRWHDIVLLKKDDSNWQEYYIIDLNGEHEKNIIDYGSRKLKFLYEREYEISTHFVIKVYEVIH